MPVLSVLSVRKYIIIISRMQILFYFIDNLADSKRVQFLVVQIRNNCLGSVNPTNLLELRHPVSVITATQRQNRPVPVFLLENLATHPYSLVVRMRDNAQSLNLFHALHLSRSEEHTSELQSQSNLV